MKTIDLSSKIILITGASSGIGSASAIAFDAAGASVAIAARREDKLREIAAKMNSPLILRADLSDENQAREMVDRVVARHGRIDVLVNNAASIIVAAASSVTSADLLKSFWTNLLGPVAATQQAVKYMAKQGGGQIINVGSPGFMMGIPFYAPYVCSKAAFSAWTRTIQAEWAGTGIIVSEYFPGYIKTNSPPESRVGHVEQDFLMEEHQNFLTKMFAKPKTAEDVARHLIRLVSAPRPLAYSGIGVRLGAFISNFSGFRMAISTQMAETAKRKQNLSNFEEKML